MKFVSLVKSARVISVRFRSAPVIVPFAISPVSISVPKSLLRENTVPVRLSPAPAVYVVLSSPSVISDGMF